MYSKQDDAQDSAIHCIKLDKKWLNVQNFCTCYANFNERFCTIYPETLYSSRKLFFLIHSSL